MFRRNRKTHEEIDNIILEAALDASDPDDKILSITLQVDYHLYGYDKRIKKGWESRTFLARAMHHIRQELKRENE